MFTSVWQLGKLKYIWYCFVLFICLRGTVKCSSLMELILLFSGYFKHVWISFLAVIVFSWLYEKKSKRFLGVSRAEYQCLQSLILITKMLSELMIYPVPTPAGSSFSSSSGWWRGASIVLAHGVWYGLCCYSYHWKGWFMICHKSDRNTWTYLTTGSSTLMYCVDCCRLNKYIVILMANNKFFLLTPYSDEVYQNGTGKWFPLNWCFSFIFTALLCLMLISINPCMVGF